MNKPSIAAPKTHPNTIQAIAIALIRPPRPCAAYSVTSATNASAARAACRLAGRESREALHQIAVRAADERGVRERLVVHLQYSGLAPRANRTSRCTVGILSLRSHRRHDRCLGRDRKDGE